MKISNMEVIESTVSGIPCMIGVVEYDRGHVIDWVLLDRKGYRAKWLEKKVDLKQEVLINETIIDYFN